MLKTYKFKLYKSKHNKKLHRQINAAGLTYNHCIALHRRYYRLYKKSLKKARLQKHLTKLKRIAKFSYLLEFGSQAVQDVADRIEFGYQKFFRKENKRPPKFRKVSKTKSFTLKQAGWKFGNARLTSVAISKKCVKTSLDCTVKSLTKEMPFIGNWQKNYALNMP